MTIFQAIILGIVQGITEFLPVSSSAHLAIFPWIFNWSQMPDSFDVALHLGTFLAIFIFFIKDWIILLKCGFNQVVKKEKTTEGRIFWNLFVATIMASGFTLICDKISEKVFGESILPTAIAMIGLGILLYVIDKKAKSEVSYENISNKQGILIGLSQAIAAAIPGVSRSGITMTVARGLGVDRESSAKYSFLLGTPITFGALVFKLSDFVFDLNFLFGVLASFIVGMIVIKFFLNYLKKGSFKLFAIYRVIVGVFICAMLFIK